MRRYIDADKLIEEIKERIKAAIEWGKRAETEEIKIRAEQAVATFCEASLTAKKLSTADIRENIRGEWIKKEGSLWTLATCSVCGELSVEGDKPFCPNCGADMRGEA